MLADRWQERAEMTARDAAAVSVRPPRTATSSAASTAWRQTPRLREIVASSRLWRARESGPRGRGDRWRWCEGWRVGRYFMLCSQRDSHTHVFAVRAAKYSTFAESGPSDSKRRTRVDDFGSSCGLALRLLATNAS